MANDPIYILDHRFDAYAAVDAYQSLIWAERYSKCGDFELYIPATKEAFSLLSKRSIYRRIPKLVIISA